MKNINNKGFAISGIVYTIFLMFITILTIILMLLLNRKVILDKEKKDLLTELDGETAGDIIDLNRDGTAVYFDPEKGEICNTYVEENSEAEVKNGCMKWYTFGGTDGGTMVNLLLDHNTTAKTAWNTNNNTDSSQIDVKVKNDTITWKEGLNPRLITADEIAKITGNTVFKSATADANGWFYFDSNNQTQMANLTIKSKYAWLFDRTSECENYGCNIVDNSTLGYWTSIAVSESPSYVWCVYYSGSMSSGTFSSNHSGIRPVITVPKSSLL